MPERSVIWKGQNLRPPRIFCIGKNFSGHVKEMGDAKVEDMVIFMKPSGSITDELRAEAGGESLHFEGEICFLIEGGHPVGVGFGLDLTKRGLQRSLKDRGLPWELSKAFRGSALFSEFLPLEGPMESLEVELEADGECLQRGNVTEMIHSPEAIMGGLKAFQDLEDGDLVMTGTPAGVGPLLKGKTYVGRILSAGKTLTRGEWKCR